MSCVDELKDGRMFILKIRDAARAEFFWVEKLRGETAARWYDIYRNSDWPARRRSAMDAFHNRVDERVADKAQRANRCVVIHTPSMTVDQLSPAGIP
jgi:hypothetical protein